LGERDMNPERIDETMREAYPGENADPPLLFS
jgi:hypothetical protein